MADAGAGRGADAAQEAATAANARAQLVASLVAGGSPMDVVAPPGAARPFSLSSLLGGISPGSVTVDQAQLLQKAILCIRDPQLQGSLSNLVTMKPHELQNVLNSNASFSLKDVIQRLQENLDPVKAQQAFGGNWDYAALVQATAPSYLAPPQATMTAPGMAKMNALATLHGQLTALGAPGGLTGLQTALLMVNRAGMGGASGAVPGQAQALLAAALAGMPHAHGQQQQLLSMLGQGVAGGNPLLAHAVSAAPPTANKSLSRGPSDSMPRAWVKPEGAEAPSPPTQQQEPEAGMCDPSTVPNLLTCSVCQADQGLPNWAQGQPGGPLDFAKLPRSTPYACSRCKHLQVNAPQASLSPLPLPSIAGAGVSGPANAAPPGLAALAGDLAVRLSASSGRPGAAGLSSGPHGSGQLPEEHQQQHTSKKARKGHAHVKAEHGEALLDDLDLQEDEAQRAQAMDASMSHHTSTNGSTTLARHQQLIVEGPQALQPVLSGPEEVTCFLEALQLSEYTIAFADVLGVVPMSVCEVQHAVCWPLEGDGRIEALYCGLLEVLVAAWQIQHMGTPLVARCKRWRRLLARSIGHVSAWQELVRRYFLFCRSGQVVSPEELEPSAALLRDDLAAVHGAVSMGRNPHWKVAPALHLRMLTMMTNDTMSCAPIPLMLTKRADDTKLLANRQLLETEGRRRDRDDLHRAPSRGRGRGKARGKGRGAAAAAAGWANGVEGAEGGEEEEFLSVEAQLERDVRAQGVRSEPLGCDRHHRRYLWVPHGGQGHGVGPGSVVVHFNWDSEGSLGGSLALLTQPAQLQDLMSRLNKNGYREGPLLSALHRLVPRIHAGMAQIQLHEQLASRASPEPGLDRAATQPHPSPLRPLSAVPATPVPHLAWPAATWSRWRPGPRSAFPGALPPEAQAAAGVPNSDAPHKGGEADQSASTAIQGMIAGVVAELDAVAEELAILVAGDVSKQASKKQVDLEACRSWLHEATTAESLVEAVARVEGHLAQLYDDMPLGADDASLESQVAEVEMYEAEFVLPAAPSLAPPPVTPKSEPEPLGSQDTEDDPSGSPEAKAGVQEQPLANPTAQATAIPTGAASMAKQVVSLPEVDDYDPDREVDRERTYERNAAEHNRARAAALAAALAAGEPLPNIPELKAPPFALWRAPADRLTWLRDLRRARLTGCPASAAFCALFLADRCQMLLRKLRKDAKHAGQERVNLAIAAADRAAEAAVAAALEKERADLMMAGPRKRKPTLAAEGSLLMAGVLGLPMPSLDMPNGGSGMMGQEGSSSARQNSRRRGQEDWGHSQVPSTQMSSMGSSLQMSHVAANAALAATAASLHAQQMWICASCKGDGEVLMCEFDGCPVLLHPQCCGLSGVPEGDWFCPVHAHMALLAPGSAVGQLGLMGHVGPLSLGLQGMGQSVNGSETEDDLPQQSGMRGPSPASSGRGRGRGRGGRGAGTEGSRGRGRGRGRGAKRGRSPGSESEETATESD